MCGERQYRLTASKALIEKAARFIRSAQILAADGDFDSAASRLYYAMFYIAEALLEEIGLSFSSHKAVISTFGQQFAKTREMEPRFHQALLGAFSQRQLGDYTTDAGLGQSDIEDLLTEAQDFLSAGRDWLARHEQARSV